MSNEYLTRKARNSKKTAEIYASAIREWVKANNGKNAGMLLLSIKLGKTDVYESLDRLVSYLQKKSKAPKTIGTYLGGIKGYLAFEDIEISDQKFRVKVAVPKQYEVSSDRIPTKEEIQRVFLHSSLEVKALIASLCSTGLRLNELLHVKVSHVDFDSKPPRIRVFAKDTKTRRTRLVFLTDEAAALVKEFLGQRVTKADSYIFGDGKPLSPSTAYDVIMNAIEKAGLRYKVDGDSRRYAIHPHVFRKFFMTRLLSAGLDRGVIEALMGHKFGLDSAYLRLTEEEIANMYLKAAPHLTILQSSDISREEIRNEVELGMWHLLVDSSFDDPYKVIKNYDDLSATEKIKELKATMLKVMHDSNTFLDITDPAQLTPDFFGWTLPIRKKGNQSSSYPDSEHNNSKKYNTVIVNADDESKLIALANRGYEIGGNVNGRVLMRRLL